MRRPQPGGRPPVDRADVIARAVTPQLLEGQAPSAQPRRVPPTQQAVHRLPRQQREIASFELQPHEFVKIG